MEFFVDWHMLPWSSHLRHLRIEDRCNCTWWVTWWAIGSEWSQIFVLINLKMYTRDQRGCCGACNNATLLLQSLHWLPVRQKIHYKLNTFKVHATQYLPHFESLVPGHRHDIPVLLQGVCRLPRRSRSRNLWYCVFPLICWCSNTDDTQNYTPQGSDVVWDHRS